MEVCTDRKKYILISPPPSDSESVSTKQLIFREPPRERERELREFSKRKSKRERQQKWRGIAAAVPQYIHRIVRPPQCCGRRHRVRSGETVP